MHPFDRAAEHLLHHTGDEPHFLMEMYLTNHALLGVFAQKVGMPPARLGLLRTLAVGPTGGMGVMELAREVGVNPAAISRQIAHMDAKGLIERLPDPEDARRWGVRLTEKGLQVFAELHERMHKFEEQIVADVEDRDLTVTTTTLAKIRSAIESMNKG